MGALKWKWLNLQEVEILRKRPKIRIRVSLQRMDFAKNACAYSL